MARLNADDRRALLDEIISSVKTFTPEWTAAQSSDPGVTLIELLAWLADVLSFEQDTIAAEAALPEHTRHVLRQLERKLASVCPDGCNTSGALIRPNYFSGQLLTAKDFQDEQNYHLEKRRIQNRFLFGSGIGSGFEVTPDKNSNDAVVVAPGYAIDNEGEEIVLGKALRCPLKANIPAGYVSVRFCEQAAQAVRIPSQEQPEPSRIKEGTCVDFGERTPERNVVLARLTRKRGKWTIDSQFRPAKIKFRG